MTIEQLTPQEVARRALEGIRREAHSFCMDAWVDFGQAHTGVLEPDDSPEACGTTLCMAGWAVHVAGYRVNAYGQAYIGNVGPDFYDLVQSVDRVARGLLGLSNSAPFYFSEDRAVQFLEAVVEGEDPNDALHRIEAEITDGIMRA
jgi:hypothetical protein